MQWTPCIDAITPSCPKRGMSATEMLRVLHAPPQITPGSRVGLERLLEDVERLAIGAIADGVHAQLIVVLQGEPCGRGNHVDGVVFSPVLSGLSGYGSRSHAPRDPNAPSMECLIARTVRCPLP